MNEEAAWRHRSKLEVAVRIRDRAQSLLHAIDRHGHARQRFVRAGCPARKFRGINGAYNRCFDQRCETERREEKNIFIRREIRGVKLTASGIEKVFWIEIHVDQRPARQWFEVKESHFLVIA